MLVFVVVDVLVFIVVRFEAMTVWMGTFVVMLLSALLKFVVMLLSALLKFILVIVAAVWSFVVVFVGVIEGSGVGFVVVVVVIEEGSCII